MTCANCNHGHYHYCETCKAAIQCYRIECQRPKHTLCQDCHEQAELLAAEAEWIDRIEETEFVQQFWMD